LLAMVVNDNAWLLVKRGALESIASELAPTIALTDWHQGKPAPTDFVSGKKSSRCTDNVGAAVRRFDLPAMRPVLATNIFCQSLR
jgi:hypothetical protein